MERPVKIATYQWAVNNPLVASVNPWDAFFNTPSIRNRINNFALMRCKLRVKAVVNGNSFHYGRLIMSYKPLHQYDQTSQYTASLGNLSRLSMRPHIYIDPTTSQGGQMLLPFFWYKNWLSISELEWSEMGLLELESINPLKHANAGTDDVNITLFAWAEDFTMSSVPTTYISQGGDEYGTGIVSRPASAISNIAARFSSLPVIGRYAKATSMAASAVSSVASLFGFSRPTILSNINLYKPIYVGNTANTDAHEAVNKLTVDSKQELSIDSRTTGLSGHDELSILSMATHESYLNQFQWKTDSGPDAHLFSIRVTPVLFNRDNGGQALQMTPVCAASQPFTYWSGTMKFRFQIVASQYHKGRIRVVYDPHVYSGNSYNLAYTRVVDLAEERDFEIDVSWAQTASYVRVGKASTVATNFSSSELTTINPLANGILKVYVVNKLVTPNTTVNNDISVNVFVRAGEDIEFSAPNLDNLKDLSYFRHLGLISQSGEEQTTDDDAGIPCEAAPILSVGKEQHIKNKNLVYFGENLASFRTLLKRYMLHSGDSIDVGTDSDDFRIWRIISSVFPPYRGYDANGTYGSYTMANMTLLNYLTPMFVGWRGGIRYKYLVEGDTTIQYSSLAVSRETSRTGFSNTTHLLCSHGASPGENARHIVESSMDAWAGAYYTPVNNQPVAEVEYPFYSPFRFAFARNLSTNPGLPQDVSNSLQYRSDVTFRAKTGATVMQRRLVSTGEDFNLYFFLSVPVLYYYGNPI